MKHPEAKGKTSSFTISAPKILVRLIDKKTGQNTADAHSRYFTELAAKDLASGGIVHAGADDENFAVSVCL